MQKYVLYNVPCIVVLIVVLCNINHSLISIRVSTLRGFIVCLLSSPPF